ncbi:MAG: chalcone isomerase family protein [Deltaproteobacteria bacterium]|nr:chalcone isomerase family protein [Deltaproteobacteria bacterium]
MIKKLLIVLLAVLFIAPVASAVEVGGKNLPEKLQMGDTTVFINGSGIRMKAWIIKVYACGLYLTKKMNDPQKIMDADEPMAIRMHVISGLMSYDKLVAALREGFEKATKGNIGPIKAKIDKYIAAHKGEVKEDKLYQYEYVPGEGTSVVIDGRKAITVEGLDFKKAVFGIWLCDEPADADLKERLIGNEE